MRAIVLCACLALLAWTGGPFVASAKPDAPDKQVRVTADRLNIRSGPSTGDAVVSSAPRGSVLVELGRDGDWVNVRTQDGTIGWAATRYLEPVEAAPDKAESPAPGGKQPTKITSGGSGRGDDRDGGGGAGALRAVAKWGCLVGALAAGGLAYSERSSGNDTYEEYKTLFRTEGAEAAEPKYQETEDHDGKAQTYAIVAGGLGALWILQQFILGGDGGKNDTAQHSEARQPEPGPMSLVSGPGTIGARFILARF